MIQLITQPCTDYSEAFKFAEHSYGNIDCFFGIACDITFNSSGERTGTCSAQGWDIFFEKQYLCRVYEKEDAKLIIQMLKEDPNLAPVFQVHAT